MARELSAVLEYGVPEPGETARSRKTSCVFTPTHGIYPLISNPGVPRLSS
jgi:hypothetical protein